MQRRVTINGQKSSYIFKREQTAPIVTKVFVLRASACLKEYSKVARGLAPILNTFPDEKLIDTLTLTP